MKEYFPVVASVEPLDGFKVLVTFDDGKVAMYDGIEDIKRGGVFEPLRDSKLFKETCVVLNGTLAWDLSGSKDVCDCVDIDPFTLYELPETK